uniref:2-hydroxy-6-oxononadienedioate/2-hydroxy-6- oxononatrienedioate hydrolase n=1 Tax=Erigeron canadensis TaxID=72917 RepID=UPI001CB9D57C|nr:2-hydroxy-6-oxononadienedioate/2-hydroxy-6-oxononatrienedioate hydrolase [Erigeron canadensis]
MITFTYNNYNNNQFVIPGPPVAGKFPAVKLKPSVLQFLLDRHSRFSIKTAASSSFVGPGSVGSSEPLSTVKKKKGKRIAGIDQDELVDPKLLADPDSCFCEFQGLQLHHKICDSESETHDLSHDETATDSSKRLEKLKFPMILLHGFGASLFSWNPVMKRLAKVAGSRVLSFDRPAFGLTSRVDNPSQYAPTGDIKDTKPLNPYSMAFSVLATLYFIDFLGADKAILVGHSAGCLVAAQTYFQAPERVAAMILVAPAIIAPSTSHKKVKANDKQDSSNSDNPKNPFFNLLSIVSKFSRFIAQTVIRLFKGMASMVDSLYKKALSAFLRSPIAVMLVRMVIDKFGVAGIKNAWYDASQVTDSVLESYTRPLRTKGWDRALVEFTAEMLAGSVPELNPPLPEKLKEISCPVLIVTGDSDRLVPSWNSVKLSQAIPGSHLEVIKKCGHIPHEEKPEEFVRIVDNFLTSVFGRTESQPLPAAV